MAYGNNRINRLLVAQSGGPTGVIDWEVAGVLAAAKKGGVEVYGARNGLEGVLYAQVPGNIVDLTPIDPAQFMHNGPGAGLKTTRIKPTIEQYKTIAANLDKLGVDAMVYIGGNDSADQLLGLISINGNLYAIHATKTIDCDLPEAHHTPGTGSTSLWNAIAMKHLESDLSGYSVKGMVNGIYQVTTAPLTFYQVMGRNSGHQALATAFARVDPSGKMVEGRWPNMILTKERRFNWEECENAIKYFLKTYGNCMVAVQEELTDEDGQSMSEKYGKGSKDSHGHQEHGRSDAFSSAHYVAQKSKGIKVDGVGKVKSTVINPQHLQRCMTMSVTDASEAYQVGYSSVTALLDGETKKSVILVKDADGRIVTALTDLENIAKKEKPVDPKYIKDITGPNQEFVDEYLPTIGGPAALPFYSEMDFKKVLLP